MLPGLQANQLARPTARTSQAKRAGVYFFEAPHCARLGDGNGARTLSAGKNKQMEGIFKVASHIAPPCKKGLYLLNVWRSTSGFGGILSLQNPGTESGAWGSPPQPESPLYDRGTVCPHGNKVQVSRQKASKRRKRDNALNGKRLPIMSEGSDLIHLRDRYALLTRCGAFFRISWRAALSLLLQRTPLLPRRLQPIIRELPASRQSRAAL
jgi:hypothetical protein